MFVSPRVVHGGLQVLRMVHLNVHLDMFRKTADVELRLLTRVEVALMAEDGVVAIRVVLDRGGEGQSSKLHQTCAPHRGSETKLAQLAEALPGWHAFILFESIVPRLCSSAEMVRRQPCAIRGECAGRGRIARTG